MANKQHLKILRQGLEAWNEWRRKNPGIKPDLRLADLRSADLFQANLSGANLSGANFNSARLGLADLHDADLSGARLVLADLHEADFSRANLSGADLSLAVLFDAEFGGADLSEATVGGTIFGEVDLSAVKGLETVRHINTSTIGVDTLYASRGKIPEVFLRGCGVPDRMIAFIASLPGQPETYRTKLRLTLDKYFNEGELRNLYFDMNVDYEGLPGESKSDKARELVAYCERRQIIPDLVAKCRQLRPNVSWEGQYE